MFELLIFIFQIAHALDEHYPDFNKPPYNEVVAMGEDIVPCLQLSKKVFPRWKVNIVIREIYRVKIEKLIDRMGDMDFEVRESAERELFKYGWYAKMPLYQTCRHSKDPEILWRADHLIEEIDNSGQMDSPDPEDVKFPDISTDPEITP